MVGGGRGGKGKTGFFRLNIDLKWIILTHFIQNLCRIGFCLFIMRNKWLIKSFFNHLLSIIDTQRIFYTNKRFCWGPNKTWIKNFAIWEWIVLRNFKKKLNFMFQYPFNDLLKPYQEWYSLKKELIQIRYRYSVYTPSWRW